MRENRVLSIWREGGAVLNGWLQIPSSFAAEVMAHQGWDSLTIDMQHGPVDYADALPMLQAISSTDVTPLARVPWNEPGVVMKMLDAGCLGVVCPMVNTRDEAERFVGACRYPPLGYRSYGPTRTALYHGPDYAARANESVIAMAMIETAQAMENLEEILSVTGLDAVYIGPSDLSQSLGFPPLADPSEPRIVEAMDEILAACTRRGVVAGLHTASAAYALRMVEKGYRFVTIGSDARLLAAAAGRAVGEMRPERAATPAAVGPY